MLDDEGPLVAICSCEDIKLPTEALIEGKITMFRSSLWKGFSFRFSLDIVAQVQNVLGIFQKKRGKLDSCGNHLWLAQVLI